MNIKIYNDCENKENIEINEIKNTKNINSMKTYI